MDITEIFGQPIHTYTRADMLADGELVTADPKLAREAGFTVPVALTRAVYEDCVAWAEADNDRKGTLQDQTGRLWDVLWMAAMAVRYARAATGIAPERVNYTLRRVARQGRGVAPRKVQLVLHFGPGDQGELVVTVMQPGEG